jgi:twitching motility two-component system response regulator PilH
MSTPEGIASDKRSGTLTCAGGHAGDSEATALLGGAHLVPPAGHEANRVLDASAATPRILIIDDELEHAEICAALLRRRGYRVALACSGGDGLALARVLKPDLVLLDVYMPTLDGYATAAELREAEETHDVPIVFVSASEIDVHAQALGEYALLSKPFRAADLIACVERSLGRTSRRTR